MSDLLGPRAGREKGDPAAFISIATALGSAAQELVLPIQLRVSAEVRFTEIPSRSKGMREDKMPPPPERLVQAH